MVSQGLEKAESSSVPHRMSAFHPCGFRSAEAIMGFDSTSPVGSGLKKPGLQHWEGASTRSCAPLSGTDQLSLPPCAAGDSLPIFKSIHSVFCHLREIHPGKPGSAGHGQRNPHPPVQMGSDTSGRAQWPVRNSHICSRGVSVKPGLGQPALTQLSDLGQVVFSLLCSDLPE